MKKQTAGKCRYCGSQNSADTCGKCYEKLRLMKDWHWEYTLKKTAGGSTVKITGKYW